MRSKSLSVLNELYTQPAASATVLGLNYVQSDLSGFSRRRAGKGFVYLAPDGQKVERAELKARFEQLAIPPAWKDVWISPDSKAHLLVTGVDEAGRKQYIYHPEWQHFRNRLKFYHLIPFAACLPQLRREALIQLRSGRGPTEHTVLASMVLLLDKGALRIGNEVYYETNDSVGLSTLLPEHVVIDGSTIQLSYTGKHGQAQQVTVVHPELANMLQLLQGQAGPRLFCYRDGADSFCQVSAEDVNHYLQTFSISSISAKDFRSWKGTLLAYEQLVQMMGQAEPLPLKQMIEKVAEALGNTPAVAQSSYIHPDLLEVWKNGDFPILQKRVAPFKAKSYLSRPEHQLRQLLELLFRRMMAPEVKGV